jgi:putative methionine-R-sulfoxide reductase with GAF domain
MDKLLGRGLQTRLMIIYLTLLLATIGLIGFLAFNRSEASLRQRAGESLFQTATTLSDSVARFIIDRYGDVQLLAESPVLRTESVSSSNKQAFLKSVSSSYTWYNALYLVDTYGTIVAASDDMTGNMSSYDWFQKASSGEVVVTDVYYLFAARGVVITLAAPVIGPDGEQVGVLASQFSMPKLWEFINEQKTIGETGFVMLIDQRGRIISHPDPAIVFDEASRFTPAVTLQGESGFIQDRAVDGVSRIYGFAPVQKLDDLLGKSWTVVAVVPTEEVFRPIKQLGFQIAVTAIILAVVIGLATFLVTRNITRPVLRLASAAQAIQGGDLSQQVEVTSRDELGILAEAFNGMTARLREMVGDLEARTRALETSAAVSRRLSTILDQKQLVAEVVAQVRQAFDYYHVHIYLVDEGNQDLVMAGGTGEAGRAMLAAGHKLPRGKGLVGRAAETNTVVLVPDVAQEEGWLPNPLLPDTRAEVAVPIAVGERVLGVLDVQQNVVGGLGESDASLLRSITGQVAIALQNIRLLSETRQKAEREARVNLITQRIQSATTVESALQVAVHELGQALGARETSVRLNAGTQPGNGHSRQAPGECQE